jgi:hypothetical protein
MNNLALPVIEQASMQQLLLSKGSAYKKVSTATMAPYE